MARVARFFFWYQNLKIWFLYDFNGFGLVLGFFVTFFSKFGFLVFFVKSGVFGYFFRPKMEMLSSKMQNLANGFPGSEEIGQPCQWPSFWTVWDCQRWAIGTWDRYSGIPVLPEVKISTNYLNTDLFKKILNTCYWKWSSQLSVVGIL